VEQVHAGGGISETVHGTPRKMPVDHVRAYRGYRPERGRTTRLRVVPSVQVYLDISFGTPPRLGNAHTVPAGAVYGMRTGPTTLVRSDGPGILAELSPLGAHRLLGTPLWTVTDRVTDVVDVLGRRVDHVVNRLAETPGWRARVALLDDALAVRAASGPRPAPQVVWAWQRLCRSTGGGR